MDYSLDNGILRAWLFGCLACSIAVLLFFPLADKGLNVTSGALGLSITVLIPQYLSCTSSQRTVSEVGRALAHFPNNKP